jgi:hypothetical protein
MSFLPRRPAFVPKAVHMGFVVGQSGTGTDFSQSPSVVPCQYNSTVAPYLLMYHLGGQWALLRPELDWDMVSPHRSSKKNSNNVRSKEGTEEIKKSKGGRTCTFQWKPKKHCWVPNLLGEWNTFSAAACGRSGAANYCLFQAVRDSLCQVFIIVVSGSLDDHSISYPGLVLLAAQTCYRCDRRTKKVNTFSRSLSRLAILLLYQCLVYTTL